MSAAATATANTNNPFRQITPTPTGESAAPSFHSIDPNPNPPPQQDTAAPTSLALDARDLEIEEPPPYTPRVNISNGEQSLQFGPSRPFQPPPQHPSSYLSPQPTGWSTSPHHHIPGDFYNAGVPPRPLSSPSASTSTTRFQPPSQPPPSSGYLPPSGAPPTTFHHTGNDDEDDGRPTVTPMGGHPLLRNGNILVYPTGYSCYKCDNTGFKAYDPSHPCRKCWERYSKPYVGAITYAPMSSGASNSSTSRGNFQKPLPRFTPPTLRNSWSGTGSGYPGAGGQLNRGHSVSYINGRGPPPGAVVVQPGDPRIGGRLCWRCDGSGTVSFLIFDRDTCPICNGAGRTF